MKDKTLVILIAATVASMATAAPSLAADAIAPAGKIMLFDGKSFDGLVRHVRGGGDVEKTWKIVDGVIACSGNPAGYIRTEKDYKDYKLHVEYRWPDKTGNNGILVHMQGEDKVWPKSLECQGMFHNQGDFFEIGGVKFNEHTAGGHRVRGRRVAKYGEHNEKEAGEWNVYEVWCVGGTVRPYVNGKLMNEATDCALTAGKICLQSEGKPMEFRNIYIEPPVNKPWPIEPKEKTTLFDGKSLDGWIRFIPGDKKGEGGKFTVDNVWSVKEGAIHCEGKPHGYIRTEDNYANYKLHLEWRWAGEPTNSGVLLHKSGPDAVWPMCVEAQLKHENAGDFVLLTNSIITVDGKQVGPDKWPSSPKGKASNEKPAGEWNSYDIVCDGDKITLTVNGALQNEGAGAKPSSGPICLQSEGSPIQFRNIYLEPLK